MVIISETYGLSGKKHYELEELETGQRTTWVPPLAMERSKHKDALIQVAKRLEASAQQSITAFSVAAVPMQEEATANTPFGVYATKVFIPRRAPKMAEKTLDGWKQYLRLRILPAFGNVAIGEITPGRLINFFAGMQAEGLSCHTIERYYQPCKLEVSIQGAYLPWHHFAVSICMCGVFASRYKDGLPFGYWSSSYAKPVYPILAQRWDCPSYESTRNLQEKVHLEKNFFQNAFCCPGGIAGFIYDEPVNADLAFGYFCQSILFGSNTCMVSKH